MQEVLATKIKCQWCGRKVYVPLQPPWIDTEDKFYCGGCGQYTQIKEENE